MTLPGCNLNYLWHSSCQFFFSGPKIECEGAAIHVWYVCGTRVKIMTPFSLANEMASML